jgi:hypothetical protein
MHASKHSDGNEEDGDDLFWVDKCACDEIRDMVSMFRNEYKPPLTLWIERNNYNNNHKDEDIAAIIFTN